MDIPEPTSSADDNRRIACQMAVEGFIREIVDAATSVGWEETEVLSAIIEVADNRMLATCEIADLEATLKALRDKLK